MDNTKSLKMIIIVYFTYIQCKRVDIFIIKDKKTNRYFKLQGKVDK
ncbi:MAG: hypothetical protein AAB243_05045 [Planctomycetota bacterium]